MGPFLVITLYPGESEMIKTGIIGASGYTGAELIRLLYHHPMVEISLITSRQYAGEPLSACYPGLGHLGLTFEDHNDEGVLDQAELFFTALPHKASAGIVAKLVAKGKRVIDLSADFRFSEVSVYEEHYEEHPHPELFKEAVYGLTELYGEEVKGAKIVANPGCYPTCSIIPLYPLLKEGLISTNGIIIDAKSGVSGAGRGASQTTHFCEANESIKAYKVAAHRHTPEIEEHLSKASGSPVKVVFTPHLVPMSRGMLATIYATALNGVGRDKVEKTWRDFYNDTPFVEVTPGETLPDTAFVRGTNRCMIAVRENPSTGHLILLSVIDNLAKGASSQAVQNMNKMMGWPQDKGLKVPVLFP